MKNLIKIFIVSLVCLPNLLFSDNLPRFLTDENYIFDKENYQDNINQFYQNELKHNYSQIAFKPIQRRPYDVLRYDVYMDWVDVLNSTHTIKDSIDYSGINKILLKIDSADVNNIELDDGGHQITKLLINDIALNPIPQVKENILSIPLGSQYKQGDTLLLEIHYKIRTDKNIGLTYYHKGEFAGLGPVPDKDSVFIEENIAYTMSEPEDARYWMPCNDRPYDKAMSSFAVRVPKGYIVSSNGLQDSVVTDSDTSTVFYWHSYYPIATYLMSAASSKYHYFYDWYKRVSNPNDSIPIEYFVWEKDYQDTSSDGMTFNATYAVRNMPEMLKVFSKDWGEYPYKKYGMTFVQNFWASGMEHQTITTMHRNILRTKNRWGGNKDYSNQSVIAHELAHQWLGDKITCATWNDIWINEGGAVWGEALWAGRNNIKSYYNTEVNRRNVYLYHYGVTYQPPIYGPPIEQLFNYATTYCKASWVYHMLSEMLGREKFLGIMRDMLKDNAYTSMTTEDFKSYLKSKVSNPTIDFDTFFDQWLYNAGHPIYSLNIEKGYYENQDKYYANVNLQQIQSGFNIPDLFKVPLWITFYGPDGQKQYDSLLNTQKDETFSFLLPFLPDSVHLDSSRTLFQVDTIITNVQTLASEINTDVSNIYPNPIINGNNGKVDLSLNKTSAIKLFVYDYLGRPIKEIYQGNLPKGNYEFTINTKHINQGAFLLKYEINGKLGFRKFTIIQ